jgi:hypothetical protein
MKNLFFVIFSNKQKNISQKLAAGPDRGAVGPTAVAGGRYVQTGPQLLLVQRASPVLPGGPTRGRVHLFDGRPLQARFFDFKKFLIYFYNNKKNNKKLIIKELIYFFNLFFSLCRQNPWAAWLAHVAERTQEPGKNQKYVKNKDEFIKKQK